MFIISIILFILLLIAIILKPFNKKEYVYTTIIAALTFAFGLVSLKDTIFVVQNIWNAVFSLISIMIISSILDEIGFFRWAALTMAFTAEGSGKRLFFYTLGLGTIISIFFNNDGTILILTPIVYEMVKELGFKKENMIPFLFACGFIADTASTPLVVSNLANIVNADTIGINFNYYLSKMLLPGLVGIIGVSITSYIYFKKQIAETYDKSMIINPDDSVKDWWMFNIGVLVLFLVITGYFIGSKLRIPVSIISVLGAIILLICGCKRESVNPKKILKEAPWDIILFAFGMYIVVYALYINGFRYYMDSLIKVVSSSSNLTATLYTGILSTFTACTMNNLPSVMIGAFTVKYGNLTPDLSQIVAFSNVIGNDIGAKLTPIGSLATIMWINILKDKNIDITWKEYMLSAFYVITPVLLLSLFTLTFIL